MRTLRQDQRPLDGLLVIDFSQFLSGPFATLRLADLGALVDLLRNADVMVQNFRPGVIERQGFGCDAVKHINPAIVYGSISGYGDKGPWTDLPG